ncbi:Uncharacterised protein [Legionella bozemanae]|uniref:Uncharacterized protein n=1 Tax=Legionella bozemanae TaxID=447 RepID=A0A0W0RJU7_LEGBO|nr:hypothetical protein Lboz_2907 [Legionella bozemanae]STO34651.1 Uncharacterised protein [Legionella bozemanae]
MENYANNKTQSHKMKIVIKELTLIQKLEINTKVKLRLQMILKIINQTLVVYLIKIIIRDKAVLRLVQVLHMS